MKALLIVDVQNDFMPGGALAVKKGDEIIPIIQKLIHSNFFDLIVASKDWHPQEHVSFATNHPGKAPGNSIQLDNDTQILWPEHCVQNRHGSEFAPEWDTSKINKIFYKGTNKDLDSYSSFFDNCHLKATGLGDYLTQNGVHDVYISGLAADYCVKYSVLDALNLGFNVYVVEDACRGIDLHPGDVKKAFNEMAQQGAHVINSGLIPMP